MIDFNTHKTGDQNDIAVIELSGKLDNAAADYFFAYVESEVLEAGTTKVVIDCDQLSYLSSTGIGMLIRIRSRLAKQGGEIRLTRVHGMIADVLRTIRLDTYFQIYDSPEAAIESFR